MKRWVSPHRNLEAFGVEIGKRSVKIVRNGLVVRSCKQADLSLHVSEAVERPGTNVVIHECHRSAGVLDERAQFGAPEPANAGETPAIRI